MMIGIKEPQCGSKSSHDQKERKKGGHRWRLIQKKDTRALGATLTVVHTVRRHLAQVGSEENRPRWEPHQLTDDQRLES